MKFQLVDFYGWIFKVLLGFMMIFWESGKMIFQYEEGVP